MSKLEKTIEKEKALLIFQGGTCKYGRFQTSLEKVPEEKKEKYEFVCYYKTWYGKIVEKNILDIKNGKRIIINLEKINDYNRIIVSPLIGKEEELLKKIEIKEERKKEIKNYQGKIFLYQTYWFSENIEKKYTELDSLVPSKLLDNFN